MVPTETGSCRGPRALRAVRRSCLVLEKSGKGGGVTVLHRLQMLAIQDELTLALEHLVARPDEPQFRVFRTLLEMGRDRVDRIADEYGLDEPQFVGAVGKGVDAICGDEAEARGEHEGAGDGRLPKISSRSANIWSA